MTNNYEDALIHGYRFDRKGKTEQIGLDSAGPESAADSFIWLHFDLNASGTTDWLKQYSQLEPLMVEAMIAEDTRPRCLPADAGILLILRGVNLNPGQDADDMISIRLWIEHNRVISVRRRKLSSIQGLREQIQRQQPPKSSTELIVDLCDHMIWDIGATVEHYEEQLAELEDYVLNTAHGNVRHELQTIRRQLITLQRYLAPQREALNHLLTEKIDWIEKNQKKRLREISDRLVRYLEDLSAMKERSAVVQQELSNQLAEKANARVYLLSIITAIFLPISFITGLLGINVAGLPGLDNPQAFKSVVIVLIAIVIVQVCIMRWKKWL
ncbi:zinc transporter ZntB [Oceanospirillum sediminis]|uniref:Zinc transporter ZntB n=1 Tax=Oceanospirillum sediminis TaxID=2760088 RepID=A0A839IT60_9GAMM|nr:zinc transporter ZntB [Oceanospirillum sediminis]MBB1487870.1 zinc transporter ZntB [Oceanospirillum sediminis]